MDIKYGELTIIYNPENTNIITKHRTTTTKKNNIYYKNKNFLSLIESVIS